MVSPLYGVWPAQPFFKSLFAATAKSTTTLINVFDSSQNGAAVALQFRYVWTLATGKTTKFDCVDVFELTADRRRFQKMTIIYDTGAAAHRCGLGIDAALGASCRGHPWVILLDDDQRHGRVRAALSWRTPNAIWSSRTAPMVLGALRQQGPDLAAVCAAGTSVRASRHSGPMVCKSPKKGLLAPGVDAGPDRHAASPDSG